MTTILMITVILYSHTHDHDHVYYRRLYYHIGLRKPTMKDISELMIHYSSRYSFAPDVSFDRAIEMLHMRGSSCADVTCFINNTLWCAIREHVMLYDKNKEKEKEPSSTSYYQYHDDVGDDDDDDDRANCHRFDIDQQSSQEQSTAVTSCVFIQQSHIDQTVTSFIGQRQHEEIVTTVIDTVNDNYTIPHGEPFVWTGTFHAGSAH